MPGWPQTLITRNKPSLRLQAFTEQFGWDGNTFKFAGIPIDFSSWSSQAKAKLFFLTALCFISKAQAEDDIMYFTDPSGNITYKYKIYNDDLDDYTYGNEIIKNLKKVPSQCNALIVSATNDLFNLFYTSKTKMTVDQGDSGSYDVTVNTASIYRAGNSVDYTFEDCMENGMNDADDLNASTSQILLVLGLVFGSIALCGVLAGLIACYCNRPDPKKSQPLLPINQSETPRYDK